MEECEIDAYRQASGMAERLGFSGMKHVLNTSLQEAQCAERNLARLVEEAPGQDGT